MAIPTQARLRELFYYDPQSGHLITRVRETPEFDALARARFMKRVGKPAGSITAEGYRRISVDKKSHLAHRLVWLFVIGEWVEYPAFEIDHVNGDRSDNRIQNLRKATKSMNQRNGSLRVDNRSGVIGVNWKSSKQRWVARIWDGPKHQYLGQFRDLADAAEARAKAERELGYHEGHGKLPAKLGIPVHPLGRERSGE